MPASQLKRLKASLRDQGVTGPQKSKKQKKQQAANKNAADRNQRHAALQQIRDSFNPFEVKAVSARPEKFASANTSSKSGGRYKDVLHRPGVSKSAGEEMRRNTLLPELRRRNKVGGVIDRRIGEGDTDMTPEERAVQRFAREKERKAKGRSMFDLEGSDDEGAGSGFGLTHGGRRLDDLEVDDFGEMSGGDESEDDGELLTRKRRRDSDSEVGEDLAGDDEEEEQPERKKTKKEVMEEVIAKSKLHKYERQKAKEDDDDLRMELDQGVGELLGLLQGVKKAQPKKPEPALAAAPATGSSGPTINPDRQRLLDGMDRDRADKEYDVRLKQLANDARAKPSERSKTAEEKAKDEAERLRVLEEKRQKRMRGEDVSDDGHAADEDVAPGADEDIPDQAAEFGFTSSTAAPKQRNEQLVLEDEDEFALDEDLVASDEEIEDAELSEDEETSDSEADDDGPRTPAEDEEDEFVKDILGPDIVTKPNGEKAVENASGLAYTYPCPRNHDELLGIVKELPHEQLPVVIQRIRKLYHPSLSASNKESVGDFSCALVDHLAHMSEQKAPMAVMEQVIRHLHSLSRTYPTQIGEQFRQHLLNFHARGQPSRGDLMILTAIGSIYPTSDHWHQVVTPAITLMARWLGLNAPLASKSVEPSTLSTGAFMVALCLKYQSLSKRHVPESLRFTLRSLTSKPAKELLQPHLSNLITMADLWKDKSAFIEIFTPALPVLKSVSAKKEHQHLNILLRHTRLQRRPLQLHNHRPLPIRTSVPKFEENFNPDKHYDPDKDRSELKKLQKEHKRERKGALRELRKDANFIAREQLKEKRERDAEYERKQRRLIAEIQGEEGREANEYAREKRRRTRK